MSKESRPNDFIPADNDAASLVTTYQELHDAGWSGMCLVTSDEVSLHCQTYGAHHLTAEERQRLAQIAVPGQIQVSAAIQEPQELAFTGSDTENLTRVMQFLIDRTS